MRFDRHNRWFQAAIALSLLCFLVSAVELVAILGGGSVPPEWTNWVLIAMPAGAIAMFVMALLRPRAAQTA